MQNMFSLQGNSKRGKEKKTCFLFQTRQKRELKEHKEHKEHTEG